MLYPRIIFLSEDRYSKYDHNRFGFHSFQKRGFSVEYWDCSKIYRPNFQGDNSSLEPDGFSGLQCFKKINSLLDSISRLTSRDTLILNIGYNIKTWSVLRCAASTKAILGMLRLGNIPIPKWSSFKERLEKILGTPSILVEKFFQKMSLTTLGLRPLDFIFQGGAGTLLGREAHFKSDGTKILHAHAMDYDQYLLSLSDNEENIYPENVVFLDSGGPFHRDQHLFNISFPCSVEEYFFNLNSVFRIVEKKFNCSVLVASHPRVEYGKKGNPFEGRRVVEGATQKLVKHSKFVLSTTSTAVNFPVIYKKPIVFLSINPTKSTFNDSLTAGIAKKLGKSPIPMTDMAGVNWEQALVVKKDCYNQYMETYIKKKGSPEKPSWEILADYLTSISG